MEEASCDKAFYVSNYQDNTDNFSVIQGPAARIRPTRLPEDYLICEFLLKTAKPPLVPSLAVSLSVRLFVRNVADLVLCFSPQSTMRAWWRTCRYAKYSKCDFCVDMKNERLSACLVSRQTKPFSLRCVLILLCCVCSEVQDRWPANEALPQRKPPQEDALCQKRSHRERTPLHGAGVAGCAVSLRSGHCLYVLTDWGH